MTPERLMRLYLNECRLHVTVLAEAMAEARQWLPFDADGVKDPEIVLVQSPPV